MQICNLTIGETEKMQHLGILPSCKAHEHISRSDARELVDNGQAKFVNKRAIAPVKGAGYQEHWYDRAVEIDDGYLGTARSGSVRTLQLLNYMPRTRPHYPIPACGARNRPVNVSEINYKPGTREVSGE